jgi:hypothetical protein
MIDKVANSVGKQDDRSHYDRERHRSLEWSGPFMDAIHQPVVYLRKALAQAYVCSPQLDLTPLPRGACFRISLDGSLG